MKIPASVRASVARAAVEQLAPVVAASTAIIAYEEANALVTREDRLRWLRAFATGAMTFPKYQRGMLTQVAADAPLRLRAVEVLARIEGDLKEQPFIGTVERMVLTMPSNGRERVIDVESESA